MNRTRAAFRWLVADARFLFTLLVVCPLVYGGCLMVKVGLFLNGDGWMGVDVSRPGHMSETLW